MSLHALPALNASLNALSAVLLVAGWCCIKKKQWLAHACCMITAFLVSSLFLSCYLYYHFHLPGHHVPFTTPGWPRVIYFFILFTHLPLALVLVPLVIMTFVPALSGRFSQHKKIAHWTLPIWLYVSVTGVLVYCMLYLWYPTKL